MQQPQDHQGRARLVRSCSVIALTSALSGAPPSGLAQDLPLWRSFVDAEGQYADHRGFGGADAYIGIHQTGDDLIYANLRGVGGDGYAVSDAGIIYRVIDRDTEVIFGGNVFAHVEVTDSGNTFVHGSLGAEMMGEDWEVRGNFYYPFTDEDDAPALSKVFLLPGNELRMRAGEDRGLMGGDVEVGFRLPFGAPVLGGEVRLFGGAYHFAGDGGIDDITGYEGRVEYRAHDLELLGAGSRLTVYAGYTEDDRNTVAVNNPELADGVFFAGARIRVPLQNLFGDDDGARARPLTALERRMEDPLPRRDNPLVLGGPLGAFEYPLDPETGVLLSQYVELSAATPDLQATIDSHGENTFVLVSGADGKLPAGLAMTDSQTWLSGGTTIPLVGSDSGVGFAYTGPGTPAVVDGDAGASIAMRSNDHLAGFTLSNNGAGFGVTIASGSSNSTVQLSSFDTIVADGLRGLNDLDDIRIRDNTFTGVDTVGIAIGTDAANVLISGNTINAGTAAGILFGSGASDSAIVGNTVEDSLGDSIGLGGMASGIAIENNSVTGGINGIAVGDGSADVKIVGNSIDAVGGAAVMVGASAGNLLIRQNRVQTAAEGFVIGDDAGGAVGVLLNDLTDVTGDGIRFGDGAGEVAVSGNMLGKIGGRGVVFGDAADTVTVADNMLGDIGLGAFVFGNDAVAITVHRNMMGSVGAEGIAFGTGARSVSIETNTFDKVTSSAIFIGTDSRNATVSGNVASNVGGAGIRMDSGAINATITGNGLGAIGGQGIIVNDGSSEVLVSGNVLTDIGGSAIRLGSDAQMVTVTGNTAVDIIGQGISFGANAATVTVSKNTLTGIGDGDDTRFGISFGGNAGTVTIEANRLTTVAGHGVNIGAGSTDVTVKTNQIVDAGLNGIRYLENASGAAVTGNTVVDVGRNGVVIIAGATDTTITGNTVMNALGADSNGILLDSESGNASIGFTITGNTVSNVTNAGIQTNVAAAGTAMDVGLIDDNTVAGAGFGIVVGEENTFVTVSGNRVSDVVGSDTVRAIGISVNANSVNVSVDANTITNVGTALKNDGGGIVIGSGQTDVSVTGNHIAGTVHGDIAFVWRQLEDDMMTPVDTDVDGASGAANTFDVDLALPPGREICNLFGGGGLLGEGFVLTGKIGGVDQGSTDCAKMP